MECESKSDIGSNKGDRNQFKITQTVPEQRTGEARNKGTAEKNHFGHCAHTVESADVKIQNIYHGRNNITCSTNCKYRTAAVLCTLETGFVSGI